MPEPVHKTVFLPVHGIETQALEGDHERAAQELRACEGIATVCIYSADLKRPGLVEAYTAAGHRCVTLGSRTSAGFLDRLVVLLGSHQRVVSNRLTTPILYGAWLGRDVAVYGDPMHLEGESSNGAKVLSERWPEFFGERTDQEAAKNAAAAELGVSWMREPAELRRLLGWDKALRPGPFFQHWVTSPGHRAIVNVRRRPDVPSNGTQPSSSGLSLQWLLAASSYLPRPIGLPDPEAQPLRVG